MLKNSSVKKTILVLTSISLAVFLLVLLINGMNGYVVNGAQALKILGRSVATTFAIYLTTSTFIGWLDEKFANEFSFRRMAIGAVGCLVICIVVVFCLRLLEVLMVEELSLQEFLRKEQLSNYVFSVLVTYLIVGLSFIARMNAVYNRYKLQNQAFKTDAVSAELQSLKSQIDPHFLFNSLNVLGSLIEENPEKAFHFNASLSKVNRYVLEQKDKDLVALEEELDFANKYMELMGFRLEDGIEFRLDSSGLQPDQMVVPLSLQLLLENAIKHNQITSARPLRVSISIHKGELIVQNDLRKKQVYDTRKGVGLENIKSRYAHLTDREVSVQQSDDSFTVKLPLLTQKTKIMNPIYSDDLAKKRARKQVRNIRKFYKHLSTYVVMIAFLTCLNLLTGSKYIWFVWPMLGWGFGVAMHAIKVFFEGVVFGKNWEEDKMEKLLKAHRKSQKTKWE